MSAILFDMDGTLVDTEPLWFQAEKQVMAEVGVNWEPSDQVNCLGGPMERTEQYMQDRSGNTKPLGYFSERLNEVMDEKLKNELHFIPNALELLSDCKSAQIPIALVTASTGRQMRAVLERFPTGIFDTTVSKDDVADSKPDPAPYKLAASQLGVDIEKSTKKSPVIPVPLFQAAPESKPAKIGKSVKSASDSTSSDSKKTENDKEEVS